MARLLSMLLKDFKVFIIFSHYLNDNIKRKKSPVKKEFYLRTGWTAKNMVIIKMVSDCRKEE
jgi:hypothetical protein